MKKMSQQHKLSFTRMATAACGMLVVLLCVRAGLAQQVGKTPPAATQSAPTAVEPVRSLAAAPALVAAHPASVGEAQEAHETATPKKHGGEGIKVHGRWEITVKNADGTVAEHRDFENSLLTSGTWGYGSQLLAALLSGNASPGRAGLALIQSVPADPSAACFGYIPYNCTLFVVVNSPIATSTAFPVILQTGLEEGAFFTPTTGLVLSGTFTQTATGPTTYTAVQSFFPACVAVGASYVNGLQFANTATFGNGSAPPGDCQGGVPIFPLQQVQFVPLTFTLINQGGVAAPLTLAPSQTIAIKFVLTFS